MTEGRSDVYSPRPSRLTPHASRFSLFTCLASPLLTHAFKKTLPVSPSRLNKQSLPISCEYCGFCHVPQTRILRAGTAVSTGPRYRFPTGRSSASMSCGRAMLTRRVTLCRKTSGGFVSWLRISRTRRTAILSTAQALRRASIMCYFRRRRTSRPCGMAVAGSDTLVSNLKAGGEKKRGERRDQEPVTA